jgi:hypothetical protein
MDTRASSDKSCAEEEAVGMAGRGAIRIPFEMIKLTVYEFQRLSVYEKYLYILNILQTKQFAFTGSTGALAEGWRERFGWGACLPPGASLTQGSKGFFLWIIRALMLELESCLTFCIREMTIWESIILEYMGVNNSWKI